ncbi:MAG: hypothetical protein IT483_15765 [Gammaproteobacteria bacterium]|nr:hypothetical protein [Gammaproteobacteria bacterium]
MKTTRVGLEKRPAFSGVAPLVQLARGGAASQTTVWSKFAAAAGILVARIRTSASALVALAGSDTRKSGAPCMNRPKWLISLLHRCCGVTICNVVDPEIGAAAAKPHGQARVLPISLLVLPAAVVFSRPGWRLSMPRTMPEISR